MGGRLLRIAKETCCEKERKERRKKKEMPQPRLERGSLALCSGRQES